MKSFLDMRNKMLLLAIIFILSIPFCLLGQLCSGNNTSVIRAALHTDPTTIISGYENIGEESLPCFDESSYYLVIYKESGPNGIDSVQLTNGGNTLTVTPLMGTSEMFVVVPQSFPLLGNISITMYTPSMNSPFECEIVLNEPDLPNIDMNTSYERCTGGTFSLTEIQEGVDLSNNGSGDGDGDSSDGDPGYLTTFHSILDDAETGDSPLIIPPMPLNTITIYARLENLTTGCFSIAPVQLIVNSKPEIDLSNSIINSPTCAEGLNNDGVINVAITAGTGTPPFQYSIDGGMLQSSGIFTGLEAGSYNILIQDIKNCTNETALVIPESTPLMVTNTSTTPVTCVESGTFTFSISNGALPYNWEFGGTNGTGTVVSNLPSGMTNDLLITDNLGCEVLTSVSIGLDITEPTVNVTASFTELTCDNPSTTLTANASSSGGGNLFYQWYMGGTLISGETSSTYSTSEAGNYSVTVMQDNNGCDVTSNAISITAVELPVANINTPQGTIITCTLGTITLDGSASTGNGLSYQWLFNGNPIPGATNASYGASNTGNYVLEVTDANGCLVPTNEIGITDNLIAPTAFIDTQEGTIINCDQGSLQLDASGSTVQGTPSYMWSTGQSTSSITVSTLGEYVVTVTDDINDCIDFISVNISTDFTEPNVNNGNLNGCADDNGESVFNLTLAQISNEDPGDITITYYDGNTEINDPSNYTASGGIVIGEVELNETGCTANAEITLVISTIVTPTVTISEVTQVSSWCNDTQVFTVEAEEITDYTYEWDVNGTNTQVEEEGGCTFVEIEQGDILSIAVTFGSCTESYDVTNSINWNGQALDAEVLIIPGTNTLFCNRNDLDSYQWGRTAKNGNCDELLTDEIYQSYVAGLVDTDAYYYWVLAEKNACSSRIYYNETPFGRLDLSNLEDYGDLTMDIYPNPNNGQFTIELESNQQQKLDLNIFDVLGRQVFYTELLKLSPEQEFQLSLPDFQEGMYFIELTANDGTHLTEKIIIR